MNSLTPASAVAVPPAIPDRPPRVWKFWGTALWGLFIFAGMFLGQVAVIGYFVLRQGGSFDLAASDPCRRRRADHLAVGHHGIARGAAGGVDRDPSDADALCRLSRAALDLVAAISSSASSALAVLVGGWDLLSRALGREVTPGFMGEVLKSAQADGALWLLVIAFCVAAPMSEEIFARGFLYRGWSESGSASPARSSCRRWPGPRCICSTTGSSSARCFRIGLLLGYLRYRTNSTWLTIVLHGLNNLAATIRRSGWPGNCSSNLRPRAATNARRFSMSVHRDFHTTPVARSCRVRPGPGISWARRLSVLIAYAALNLAHMVVIFVVVIQHGDPSISPRRNIAGIVSMRGRQRCRGRRFSRVRSCWPCCGSRSGSQGSASQEYLALNWPSRDELLRGLAISLAFLLGMACCLSYLTGHPTPAFVIDSYRTAQADGLLWLLLIGFCIAAPVTEEFVVRGYAVSRLVAILPWSARRYRAVVGAVGD